MFLNIQTAKNKMLEADRKLEYHNSPRHKKDAHFYHKLYNEEKEASTPQIILNKFLQRNKT